MFTIVDIFVPYYVCEGCEKELTTKQIYWNGCCPHCGHTDNSTILAHETRVRKVRQQRFLGIVLSSVEIPL